MMDRLGQQLGNYQLIQLLGQGNSASVYLGKHRYLETQAAIKVLHGQWATPDIDRFLTEARTIARLRHPHIVQILDFGVEDTTLFLVMDYAPNGTLRQRHPNGTRLPLDTIVSYVKQVADALQYAHQEKVIHRDIKPENMLLGRNHEVLLSDFGIAIKTETSHSQQTREAAGTMAYMAPEQIQAHPSPASDQYTLGVVVYEWLSGDRPFSGSGVEIAAKHLLASPPFLHEKVPTIAPALEQVVLKALAKEPQERFPSVQAFALTLEEACKAEPSGRIHLVLTAQESAGAEHEFKNNLPAQLTPLVGREQELQAVSTLLRRAEVRLVTLTGTGGVGKTCLGLQVATRLQDDFVDGVCFVSLASLSDPMVVVPTIAQTLGIKESGERPLMDLLQASLGDKHVLLLLDNFEQVAAAAPLLSDLLRRCPHLKMLVTSRAVLHVHGEHEFPVLPLALPDLAHLPESEALWQYAAISLFLQRAQAARPDFQLTPTNAHTIAEICVRLEGLPLAIELAASRIKLLPPQALLARLKYRLQVLTSRAQDVQARQQTLRNTLAWSYNLLDAEEQRLFRRLCVFARGCTLAAVEAVYQDLGDMPAYVLDGVASLIDKSLLQQTEQEGEEPRFQMLETIREYGLEVLAASGEMESTRRAHAAYYVTLAEEAEPELLGPQQAAWLERLEREHDNLRAALRWTLEQAEAGDSMEMALRLGGALRQWWVHGHCPEGGTFLERALVKSEGIAAPLRAKALIAAAHLAFFQGDYDRIETLCDESLALYRELGDQAGIASSLFWLGKVATVRGNIAAARSLLMEALVLAKTMDDKGPVAWYLFNLALMESSQGEYALARTLFEESLAIHRELGSKRGIAHTLSHLAQLLVVSQGDQARVRSLLEECLALSREVGIKEMIAASYCLSGQLALSQGDLVTARTLVEKSVVLCKEVGYRHGTAESLFALGKVLAAQGDYAAARTQYEESYAISRALGERSMIAACLVELGEVVALQQQFAWAAQLWGAAEALRESIGVPILPVERADYEHSVAAAHIQLGEQAFSAAWAQGRIKTPEQALADQGQLTVPAPTPSATPPPDYPAGLTAREVEVLCLVAQGLTNSQIAQELNLSEKTVNTHLTHIFNKTSSENRAAATAFAIRHSLI